MLQHYVIDFWRWWYGVRVPEAYFRFVQRMSFVLQYTNTLEMARNLTTPLFQDNTGSGKMIAIIIRGVWVWFGGMFSIVLLIPSFLWLCFVITLPILSLSMLGIGIVSVLWK